MSATTLAPTTVTERDMLDLLLERYNAVRRGTIADRWVRAEHVRNTQQIGRVFTSIADFIAIDKYATHQAMHGHEVKVSRADWLTELKNPGKAERIKRYCHYWWLVVPDASIVKPGELPAGWGLITISGKGLRVRTPAPLLHPEPMTLDFVAGLTAAVQRTAFREPLRRDARTIDVWNQRHQRVDRLCQACGEVAPCRLHQPATFMADGAA
ncbi:hypothetical protein LG293_16100 (plasmid) [Citricoccus nitrophenolicus]